MPLLRDMEELDWKQNGGRIPQSDPADLWLPFTRCPMSKRLEDLKKLRVLKPLPKILRRGTVLRRFLGACVSRGSWKFWNASQQQQRDMRLYYGARMLAVLAYTA